MSTVFEEFMEYFYANPGGGTFIQPVLAEEDVDALVDKLFELSEKFELEFMGGMDEKNFIVKFGPHSGGNND